MNRALRLALIGVLLAWAFRGPASLSAQTLDGVLLERGSNQPIDLGLVMLLTEAGDSVTSVLTDRAGRFRLESPEPGGFLMVGAALGYRGSTAGIFDIETGGRMSVEFRLEPVAIEIAGITVETRSSLIAEPSLVRNGFVDRAKQGLGRFITPEDLADTDALDTSELLARTGRITTRYEVGGERILMLGTTGYCTPSLFLDGVRVSLGSTSIDSFVRLSSLAAVEVYRSGSEAPLQYGGTLGNGCGVIVMWTRSR